MEKNKLIYFILFMVFIIAISYSWYMYTYENLELFDWLNTLFATIISVSVAFAIAMYIYYNQSSLIEKKTKEKYLPLIEDGLISIWKGLASLSGIAKFQFSNGEEVIFHFYFIQDIIFKQAIISNVFNETETEFFALKKKPQTELKVGYLKDRLIYCNITNPAVPGYNKYVEGIYFYANDFKENDSYGDPALEFNEMNRNGILSILKNGLSGKEIQFVKNNKVLKSKLYVLESDPKFNYSFDFTGRNFWNRLFNQRIEKIEGIEKREIELNKIFGGI